MTTMKNRMKSAKVGHRMLKNKADALQLRFRKLLSDIIKTKSQMGEVMKEASFSLASAKYACGDFSQVVLQNVDKAAVKVDSTVDNVAVNELTGLARGGQQVKNIKKCYSNAIELLIKLASLQNAFIALDEAIKMTNRRVNALEY
ncbi:ATP6V1D, partial [Cordylochernes scorpioides]